MEKLISYTITSEKYKKLVLLSEGIYNTSVIVAYFCNSKAEIEEIRNLAPVIIDLKKKSDELNAEILNLNES